MTPLDAPQKTTARHTAANGNDHAKDFSSYAPEQSLRSGWHAPRIG